MQENLNLAAALASLDCFLSVDIEDSISGTLIAPQSHAAKVTAVKSRCPEVFVNARVDTYWFGQDAAVGPTVERARRYVEAGAG
jgi:2-methylisocitrate lyase-like PEP mutase family enzyme